MSFTKRRKVALKLNPKEGVKYIGHLVFEKAIETDFAN